jgi:hypothetical protein
VAADGFTLDSGLDETAYALDANLCKDTSTAGGNIATGAVVNVRILTSNLESITILDILLHKWTVYSLPRPYVFLSNIDEFGEPGNVELRGLSCSIVVDHVEMKCTTPPAVGTGFNIAVSIGGQQSLKSHTAMDYASAIVQTYLFFTSVIA